MPGVDAVKELIRQVIRKELLTGDDPVAIATGDASRIPGQRTAFVKIKVENRQIISSPGQLPDRMEDLADALAEAFAKIILSLQVQNVSNPLIPVNIPLTSPVGTPSVGVVIAIPTTSAIPNVDLLVVHDL